MLMLTEPAGPNTEVNGGQTTASVATQIDTFIASHFADAIDAPAVAEHLRYNLRYLERVYQSHRGSSITEAINLRRIREACALLRSQPEFTISEVADLCAFNDIRSFRKLFKQTIGKTPSRFKEIIYYE